MLLTLTIGALSQHAHVRQILKEVFLRDETYLPPQKNHSVINQHDWLRQTQDLHAVLGRRAAFSVPTSTQAEVPLLAVPPLVWLSTQAGRAPRAVVISRLVAVPSCLVGRISQAVVP